MSRRPPNRAIVMASIVVLMVVSACTDSDDPPAPTSTTSSTTLPVTTPPPDGRTAITTYFEALANRTAGSGEVMRSVAAPGSTADRYALHQTALRAVLGDGVPDVADIEVGGVTVCPNAGAPPTAGSECVRFADFEIDDAGRVASFTVNGTGLDSRLATDGPPATVDRITARMRSAYQSPATRATFVVLEVANDGPADIEVFGFGATYRPGPNESSIEAGASWGDQAVPAGGTTLVLVRFTDAALGGLLDISAWGDNSIGTTITVRVGTG